MTTHWDDKFLELARHVAQWSKDPRTKVGATLVAKGKKNLIAVGFNGFPPGIEDTPMRLHNRDLKHKLVQHAERNVLDNAAFNTEGATLYVTKFPCIDCTKSIISKRVAKVIAPNPDFNEEYWGEHSEFAFNMFEEAGVEMELYSVEGV